MIDKLKYYILDWLPGLFVGLFQYKNINHLISFVFHPGFVASGLVHALAYFDYLPLPTPDEEQYAFANPFAITAVLLISTTMCLSSVVGQNASRLQGGRAIQTNPFFLYGALWTEIGNKKVKELASAIGVCAVAIAVVFAGGWMMGLFVWFLLLVPLVILVMFDLLPHVEPIRQALHGWILIAPSLVLMLIGLRSAKGQVDQFYSDSD